MMMMMMIVMESDSVKGAKRDDDGKRFDPQ